MPDSIAEVYDPLWQVVQNIHFEWMVYRQLFGTSAERIDLLNRFGGAVFGTFQKLLERHVSLAIFRLLDPLTQSRGRDENLCLERLADVVALADHALGSALAARREAIRTLMDPHKDLRNKVLAHNDLATTPALYDGTSNITVPSRELIEQVLAGVRDFMDAVQTYYGGGTTAYWSVQFPAPGDGEFLIHMLTRLSR
jgi:hypothetical protein